VVVVVEDGQCFGHKSSFCNRDENSAVLWQWACSALPLTSEAGRIVWCCQVVFDLRRVASIQLVTYARLVDSVTHHC